MKRLFRQPGQSMVEYVVVLGALSAALFAANQKPGELCDDDQVGYIGSHECDKGSLIQAINQKHRGQGYALSLSEIPETDNLGELQAYYDDLEKFPELSKQLGDISNKLGQVNSGIKKATTVVGKIKKYVPPKLKLPPGFPQPP